MTYTGAQIAYRALRMLGYNRAGNPDGSALPLDVKNEMLDLSNEMIEQWGLNGRRCFHARIDAYTLTAGTQTYTLGPNGTLASVWPTEIQQANVILNTSNPPVRQPVEIITKQEWMAIRVQQIPFAIPLKLYYDANWSATGQWNPGPPFNAGNATLYLWPGPAQAYQLELLTPQQLQQFADLTTVYSIPLGYARAIISNLALLCAPQMSIYFGERTTKTMMDDVRRMAQESLDLIDSFGAVIPLMDVDPAFTGDQRGSFNYLTGGFGSNL